MDLKYYSIGDVMCILGVKSRRTIYQWMDSGRLQWTQIGGRRKFTEAQIEAFIASGEKGQRNTTPHLAAT